MKSLAFLVLSLLCAPPGSSAEPKKAAPCCLELPANPPLPDRSLYHLDSSWMPDAGKEQKLSFLRGRPQLIVMFFATCDYACPILVENLKAVERALPETLRGKVGFSLVTIAPERDTAEALRAYRTKHSLDTSLWTLLRGNADDVRELAAVLGIQYQKDARGQFSHSNVITVLDADGVVVFQQPGLNRNPGETVAALQKLPLLPR